MNVTEDTLQAAIAVMQHGRPLQWAARKVHDIGNWAVPLDQSVIHMFRMLGDGNLLQLNPDTPWPFPPEKRNGMKVYFRYADEQTGEVSIWMQGIIEDYFCYGLGREEVIAVDNPAYQIVAADPRDFERKPT